jgi:hypothetical protein
MGVVSSYFESPIMDVFFFLEKKKIWKIEKFNALKAARPEVAADTEDTMELLLKKKPLPKIYIK